MELQKSPSKIESSELLLQRLKNRLRLKHFSLLRALGDCRNLHLAAEELNMTQPSATKLLKDVESLLGLPLFVRHSRGMIPTPLGEEVIAYARLLLGQMGHFAADLENKRHGGHGFLSVGAIMGAAPDLVAPAVARMKARYPLLTIRLLGDTSDQVMQLMEAHQLELAVCRFSAAEQPTHFSFEALGNEKLLFVVSARHRLATRPVRSIADLTSEAWVMQPLPSPSRVLLEREFSSVGLSRPTNLIECSSIFAALQIIQQTEAVTLLPEPVVRAALQAKRVVALPLIHRVELPEFGVLTRRSAPLSAAAQEFIETLRALAKESRDAVKRKPQRAARKVAA
jgi:DNA-binding transcriptional LysR family regulator